MSPSLNLVSENRCFGGTVGFYSHRSQTCNGEMRFAVYQPPQATSEPVPVLYFLSGLACTEENFMVKAGAQRFAAEYGLMLVVPDTSPRDAGIEGEDDDWDFGTGASFYVDATVEPWRSHYQMYSYVVHELPALIAEHFPVQPRQGIFGHSMGGHGALVCALRNPERYNSVSAFAPIAAPMRCPWGQKAFTQYLGADQETWRAYDASELVRQAGYISIPNRDLHPPGSQSPTAGNPPKVLSHKTVDPKTSTIAHLTTHGVVDSNENNYKRPILIDQGTADPFLAEQLLPEAFEQACTAAGQPLTLRRHEGYNHSYYFISTFMEDHIRHHAAALCG